MKSAKNAHALTEHVDTSSIVPTNVEETEDYLKNFVHYAMLKPKQQLLLKLKAEDLVIGKARTTREICEEIQISERQVYRYYLDPAFTEAAGFILANLTAGKALMYIHWIEAAAKEGKWQAARFLLQLGGVYTEKLMTQNLNMNMNTTRQTPQSFDEALDDLLITLGEQGWSANQIVERFNRLRSEGAF
jgi:hypothetical protein